MLVSDFVYELPEEAIAQEAIEPRHASRLLDTRDMGDHRFLDLADLLLPGDLVVVNETKVRAARVSAKRADTGGTVELLFLDQKPDGSWVAMARPARRLRPGVELELGGIRAEVLENLGVGLVRIELDADQPEDVIDRIGQMPLPPYFKGSLDDASRYQTMFARVAGSAAAPTAGLHFTPEVVASLESRGVEMATVDLHVSLDTFRPMTVSRIDEHVMHTEWCAVPPATADAVASTRDRGSRVVAIGTTVVRTLESHADGSGAVEPGEKATSLFLRPGAPITVVDLLVTNFHLPGSTLLVLLAAFMGERWREAYRVALQREYRFLSFGDAMLAERQGGIASTP